MKKLLFLLILSVIPKLISAQFTVYYNNQASYSPVNIYYWNSANTSENNGWPGEEMTAPAGDSPWYSFNIPAGSYDRVIFNGVGGSGGQTGDLTRSTTGYFDGSTWHDTDPYNLTTGPTLTSPSNLATDVAVTTTLSWSALTNATTYEVVIDDSNDFATPLDSTETVSPFDPTGDLAYSTTYYWKVRGVNYAGNSDWTYGSFTTGAAPFTVYFENPNAWGTVRVYYWKSSNTGDNNGWPGSIMTAVGGSSPWYSYSIPNGYDRVIFNNGTGNTAGVDKTNDLSRSTTGYYTGNLLTDTWSDTDPYILSTGPTLTSPSDAATDVLVTSTLSWNSLANSATYVVVIDDSNDFATPLDSMEATSPFDPTGSLAYSTTYYWKVKGSNYAGDSDWTYSSFTTEAAPVIGTSTLTAPTDNATAQSVTPSLSWSAAANATSYRVQVSTSSGDYGSPVINVTTGTNSYEISSSLSYGTEYFWRVQGLADGLDDGSFSSEFSFTTIGSFTVHFSNPSNWNGVRIHFWGGAEGTTWPGVAMNAPVGDSPWYSFEVPNDVTNLLFNDAESGADPQVASKTADLTRSTTGYYNGTSWSDTDPFVLSSGPTISSPLDLDTDVAATATLSWAVLDNASTYVVVIDDSGDFSSPLDSTEATSPFDPTGSLAYSTTYYWKVKGSNYAGDSDWTYSSFTTMAQPQVGTPTLSTPSLAATNVSIRPTFSWSSVASATTYRLQVSTDNFSTVEIETTTGSTSYTILAADELTGNTSYQWRVRGEADGYIDGDYVDDSFTTEQTFTVYYSNPNGWVTVKAYVYTSGTPDVPYIAWPGEDMANPQSGSWYSYTIPAGNNYVIFNNGSGTQTSSLNRTTIGYYIGDGSNNIWSDTEPLQGVYTVQAGNWNDTSTWNGGILPANDDTVTIAHDVTINESDTVHTVIINSGKTLSAGSYTLTLAAGGTLSVSGTFNAETSTIVFLGSGSITGSPSVNNMELSGGVALGSGTTVNGTLKINSGGYLAQSKGGSGLSLSSQVPNYGSSSTLEYTGTFSYGGGDNFAGGWGTTAQKSPHNLVVSGTGALTVTTNARSISGVISVGASASLTTNDLITMNSGGEVFNEGTITGNLTINRDMSANKSFRMLASPVSTTASDLLAELWTQGQSAGGDTDQGGSNVWTWNSSASGHDISNWTPISNISTTTLSGAAGILVYDYDNDDYADGQDNAVTTLSVTGTEKAAPGEVSVNTNVYGYTLLGNPFASSIAWDQISKNNIYTTAHVWTPSGNDAGSWTDITGSNKIAPFQGFLVRTSNATSPSVTISASAKATGATFLGKQTLVNEIKFDFTSGDIFTKSVRLQIHDDASEGMDFRDAERFMPLAVNYLDAYFGVNDLALTINSLPELTQSVRIPLHVEFTQSGTVDLSLSSFNLPSGYQAVLIDELTNEEFELNGNFSHSFDFVNTNKSVMRTHNDVVKQPTLAGITNSNRFSVIVGPMTTSVRELTTVPTEVILHQNYPNPFNPSTQIAFELPQAMNVSIKVFDMLGREVATLLNGSAKAGFNTVTWNASNVGSGIYYYRLVAGENTITKKMTLVK